MDKIKGVTKSLSKKKPWRAYIGYNKTFKHLGNFTTIEEAKEARDKAMLEVENKLKENEIRLQNEILELKEKQEWFARCIKVIQKKFNLPISVVKFALEPPLKK